MKVLLCFMAGVFLVGCQTTGKPVFPKHLSLKVYGYETLEHYRAFAIATMNPLDASQASITTYTYNRKTPEDAIQVALEGCEEAKVKYRETEGSSIGVNCQLLMLGDTYVYGKSDEDIDVIKNEYVKTFSPK